MEKKYYFVLGLIFLLLFPFLSCSKDDEKKDDEKEVIIETTINEETEEVDTLESWLSKQIIGNWTYYSGDALFAFVIKPTHELYSQELSFIKNGNVSEKVFTSYQDETENGNWTIKKNHLFLNSWDGSIIVDTITIDNISDSEMILSYSNKSIIYKRIEWLYDSINFCNEILGFWKTMESNFPRHTYSFKSDGTVGHHDYVWENVGGYGVVPWSYNPNTRELTTSQPTTGAEITTSKVEFINKKYLRWIQTFTRN